MQLFDSAEAAISLQNNLNGIEELAKILRSKWNETKSAHATFTKCHGVQHRLGLHQDKRLTWRKHVWMQRKQLDTKFRKLIASWEENPYYQWEINCWFTTLYSSLCGQTDYTFGELLQPETPSLNHLRQSSVDAGVGLTKKSAVKLYWGPSVDAIPLSRTNTTMAMITKKRKFVMVDLVEKEFSNCWEGRRTYRSKRRRKIKHMLLRPKAAIPLFNYVALG